MPAIERGLGLVDRVVRRHVAKLEKVGWCERIPAIRGDGMLVWMTQRGLDGVGLGAFPALHAPDPFSPQTAHTVRVAWAAADLECAGREWHAIRELALEASRWSAEVANERGGRSRRLPDLVFWHSLDGSLPVTVVVVHRPSNPRRERAALEGWQASIAAGRYARVRYVAGPAAARRLGRLATDIGLTAPQFIASERVVVDEPPAPPEVIANKPTASAAVETAPVAVADPSQSSPGRVVSQRPKSEEPVETPEQAAERQKLINEVLGHGEPGHRRRWRRGSG